LILQEYAVEPTALACWDKFRYITEKFGFDQGRLISRYPGDWEDKVRRACSGLRDVEKKKVVEKLALNFRRKKMLDTSRPYNTMYNWIQNAELVDRSSPFHCIIACQKRGLIEKVVPADEIDEDNAWMHVKREDSIPRTAKALADFVTPVLLNSREILFVDPHFDPSRSKWRNTLRAFLTVAVSRGMRLSKCEYHLLAKAELEWFRKTCTDLLPKNLPRGLRLRLVRWNDDSSDKELHPRYILTDIGGVRVENGLDEHPGAETDVGLLTEDLWKRRLADYHENTSPWGKPADECVVYGTGR
jgi:hypothetical protein